jgi:outer membrane immunogenic protein
MKKLVSAGAIFLTMSGAVSGVANAADMPIKAPEPVHGWSGWYIGANAGGSWNTDPNATFAGAGPTAPIFFGVNQFPTTLSPSSKGGLGGLQTGYNVQLGSMWLIGVETDIQISHHDGTATATPIPPVPFVPFVTQVSQENSWFGTLRGRLGFLATPSWLIYGTGGVAYGDTRTSFTTTATNFGATACPVTFTCATGVSSSNRVGWAAGGGIEWMFAPQWTLRAEYLYMDLGSQSVTATSLNTLLPVVNFTATSTFKENIARAAINFGF